MQSSDGSVSKDFRYVLFPIEHPGFWKSYKDQEASFWTAEEIDMSEDVKHYRDRLTNGERRLINRVLGFFAASDVIVARNIDMNMVEECEKRGWNEAVIAYQYQIAMENIHTEAYSKMIEKLIPERERRAELFNSIHQVPTITEKAEWALRWMGRADAFQNLDNTIQESIRGMVDMVDKQNVPSPILEWIDAPNPTFGERLVAAVCVEGIFFSSSFCAIFWFKKRGLLPGIAFSNELISRDEGQHQEFSVILLAAMKALAESGSPLGEVVPHERILEIVTSAVEIEKRFIRDALPLKLVGLNEQKMCRYAEFVADRALVQMGCPRHYYKEKSPKNPCEWMERIAYQGKTNFFERRVTNYQRRGVKQSENSEKLNKYSKDAYF